MPGGKKSIWQSRKSRDDLYFLHADEYLEEIETSMDEFRVKTEG